MAVALTCRRRGRLAPGAVVLLGAGAAVLVAAALASAAPLAALAGRAPRYEGLAILPVYLGAGVAGARLLGPARPAHSVTFAVRMLALSALAIGVLALAEAFGLRPLATNVSRPGSLLGNASDEGAIGVLLAGPLGACALVWRDLLVRAGAVAAVATVALSASRGALAGALVAGAVLAALAPRRRARVLIVAGVVALGVLTLALPLTRSRVAGTSPEAAATVHGRELLWQETGALVFHHPWLGVGPSGFLDAITAEHDRTWEVDVGPLYPPDSPHDVLLQAASAGGIGLAALAVALGVLTAIAGLAAWRRERAAGRLPIAAGMLAGLAGYGAALTVHLTSPGVSALAAFFGGVLLARAPREAGTTAPARPYGAIAMGLLATVLVLATIAEIPLRSGLLDLGRGDFSSAQAEFRSARLLRPWDVEIDVTAGHALAVAADSGMAAAAPPAAGWLDAARRNLPTDGRVESSLAAALSAEGRDVQAAALVTDALSRDPGNPALLLQLGSLDLTLRRFGPARSVFDEVLTIEPHNADALHDLALAARPREAGLP